MIMGHGANSFTLRDSLGTKIDVACFTHHICVHEPRAFYFLDRIIKCDWPNIPKKLSLLKLDFSCKI